MPLRSGYGIDTSRVGRWSTVSDQLTQDERQAEQEREGTPGDGAAQSHPSIEVRTDFQRETYSGTKEKVFELKDISVFYGGVAAVRDIPRAVFRHEVTELIGPSGCGKSTLIRCLNRMNDLIPGATVEGELLYHGEDLYGPKVDPIQVRKLIGMVFKKPNPFPKSSYDNIAFGPRVLGMKGDMDESV